MSSTSYYTDGQALFVGALDRAANYPGYEWAGNAITNSSGSLSGVNGAITTAFGTIASTGLTAAQVDTISNNLIGRNLLSGGIAWVQGLYTSTGSLSQTIIDVYNTVIAEGSGTDYTVLNDRMSAANTFTNYYAPSGTGYSATEASSYIDQITPAWVGLGNTTSNLQSVSNYVNGTTGQTIDITTSQLNYSASSSNTVFVDNNAGNKIPLSAAYTINGVGGNNELKVYATASTLTKVWGSAPTLNNVPDLYINDNKGIALTLDLSSLSSVTSVTIDNAKVAGNTYGIELTGAKQTLTIDNAATSTFDVKYQGSDTKATVDLNGGTISGLNTDATAAMTSSATLTLDTLSNTTVALGTSTNAKFTTLDLTGAGNLTLTNSSSVASSVATINGSASTGNLTIYDTSHLVTKGFAFTGGSGTNTLAITTASLDILTKGSQLDGGTGSSNTLELKGQTLSSGSYTNLNATTGFHTLGLSSTGTFTVDASKLTGSMASNFAIDAANNYTIDNMANNSNVAINSTSAGTVTLSAATGNHDLNVTMNNSSGGLQTTTALDITGFNTISLDSAGSSSANNVNAITTLTVPNNTDITITGSVALTITNAISNPTVGTGNTINASAFTGALTLTDSGNGDVISTGSGTTNITDSIIAPGAGVDTYAVHDSITFLAGHTATDTYTVSAHANNLTGTTAFNADTITNFALNQDKLTGTTYGTTELTSTKGVVSSSAYSSAAKFITAAESIATAATAGDVQIWYDSTHGNTYVAEYVATAAAGSGASDAHIVELVGVHATSIETAVTTGATGALLI